MGLMLSKNSCCFPAIRVVRHWMRCAAWRSHAMDRSKGEGLPGTFLVGLNREQPRCAGKFGLGKTKGYLGTLTIYSIWNALDLRRAP